MDEQQPPHQGPSPRRNESGETTNPAGAAVIKATPAEPQVPIQTTMTPAPAPATAPAPAPASAPVISAPVISAPIISAPVISAPAPVPVPAPAPAPTLTSASLPPPSVSAPTSGNTIVQPISNGSNNNNNEFTAVNVDEDNVVNNDAATPIPLDDQRTPTPTASPRTANAATGNTSSRSGTPGINRTPTASSLQTAAAPVPAPAPAPAPAPVPSLSTAAPGAAGGVAERRGRGRGRGQLQGAEGVENATAARSTSTPEDDYYTAVEMPSEGEDADAAAEEASYLPPSVPPSMPTSPLPPRGILNTGPIRTGGDPTENLMGAGANRTLANSSLLSSPSAPTSASAASPAATAAMAASAATGMHPDNILPPSEQQQMSSSAARTQGPEILQARRQGEDIEAAAALPTTTGAAEQQQQQQLSPYYLNNPDDDMEKLMAKRPRAVSVLSPPMSPPHSGSPEPNHAVSDGLSTEEAEELLKEYGRNELAEKTTPKWLIFISRLWGPMPVAIWIAAAVEFGLSNFPDGAILLGILFANAIISFYETVKAGNAVAALKQSLKPTATVKRDGAWKTMDAALLVPGDLVLLKAGAAVPADCVLQPGFHISVDESAVSGESLPVNMSEGGQPKMGSTVVRGEGEAVVEATGMNTFFGRTAELIQSVGVELGSINRLLIEVMIILTTLSFCLCLTAFLYLLLSVDVAVKDAIEFTVVLLVASIPIAIEIVVTTTLALGSRELAQWKAIVTRLTAIEALAGMNILCSDKTGTLTMNQMEVEEECPTFLPGYDKEKVLIMAALAAKWREPAHDALDKMVLGTANLNECNKYTMVDHIPFEPAIKRTESTVVGPDGRKFRVTKGAPPAIVKLCRRQPGLEEKVQAIVDKLAVSGTRCLAVAITDTGDVMGSDQQALPSSDTADVSVAATRTGTANGAGPGEKSAGVLPAAPSSDSANANTATTPADPNGDNKPSEAEATGSQPAGESATAVAAAAAAATAAKTREPKQRWYMVGILTFLDPPRADSKETIHKVRENGVAVKMITGDNLVIAKEMARRLELGTDILSVDALPKVGRQKHLVPSVISAGRTTTQHSSAPLATARKSKSSVSAISGTTNITDYNDDDDNDDAAGNPKIPPEFVKEILKADGFAQVLPEHKFMIVQALRESGYTCGMTGDGVNDAPALKRADIGIAVSGATDVARAAADIVLSEPGLSVINEAIVVARRVFNRIKSFMIYRITATLQLLLFFFIAVFALPPSNYQPAGEEIWPDFFSIPVIMLILITVLNDGTLLTIGYDTVQSSDRPQKWNLSAMFLIASVLAAVACGSSLLLLYAALDSHNGSGIFAAFGLPAMEYGKIVALIFMKVSITDFLTLFSSRVEGNFFFTQRPAMIILLGALCALGVSTVLATLWPDSSPSGVHVIGLAVGGGYMLWPLWVWIYCIIVWFIQDILKVITYALMSRFDIFQYRTLAMSHSAMVGDIDIIGEHDGDDNNNNNNNNATGNQVYDEEQGLGGVGGVARRRGNSIGAGSVAAGSIASARRSSIGRSVAGAARSDGSYYGPGFMRRSTAAQAQSPLAAGAAAASSRFTGAGAGARASSEAAGMRRSTGIVPVPASPLNTGDMRRSTGIVPASPLNTGDTGMRRVTGPVPANSSRSNNSNNSNTNNANNIINNDANATLPPPTPSSTGQAPAHRTSSYHPPAGAEQEVTDTIVDVDQLAANNNGDDPRMYSVNGRRVQAEESLV